MTDRYSTLRQGLTGAWCPSLGGGGYLLADRSGRGNHGKLTNSAAQANWVPSGGGLALNLDGTDDFVDCGSRGGDLTDAIPFSVSLWALSRQNNGLRGLISRDSGSPFPFSVRLGGGSTLELVTDGSTVAGSTITTNTWFHLVVVLGPSLRQFWLNGVKTNESTSSYTVTADTDILRIGCDYVPSSLRCWDGFMDDIRVYNRVLLGSEIKLLASQRGIGLLPTRHRRANVLGSSMHLNVGGTWKRSTPWINVNGVWKQATPKINVGGVWK